MPMTKITRSQLKSHLINLSSEEVTGEVLELFKTFSEVREFYQSMLSQSGNAELCEKYKKVIKDEFFPERGFGKARLSVARGAVSNFKKISTDIHRIADTMIFYIETGVAFTREYGDIDEPFYNSMESMYEAAAEFVQKNGIAKAYKYRFEKMVSDTSDTGWGFHDTLSAMYEKHFSKVEA